MTTGVRPGTEQLFQTTTPLTETTPVAEPGYFSSAMRGVSSLLFSPVRFGTAEAAQGLADRFSELLNTNQPEITNRVRTIFANALLRRAPENYLQLLHHIQAFLRNPSTVDLNPIKRLLANVNATEIRSLAPQITDLGVQALTGLSGILEQEVRENQNEVANQLPTLTVGANATLKLQTAETVLKTLIENHEGVIIQTLNTLTQNINANDGPLNALRDQLNHPERGILTQSLGQLRTQLTARASPQLREAKQALDTYRNALTRDNSLPNTQDLQGKITQLLGNKTLSPQINEAGWTQITTFQALLGNPIAENSQPLTAVELLEKSQQTYQILTGAFQAQRGIIEEAADILVEGIGRGVEQLIPMPRRMLQEIFSPQQTASSTETRTEGESQTQASTATELNIGAIYSQGSQLLQVLLRSASNAFSHQALHSLATLLHYTFDRICTHIENNGNHQEPLGRIRPMMQRLKGAMTTNSWAELTGTLQDAFSFIQTQQVYFQSLRLPLNPIRTHSSAIPAFLNNMNAHQNALSTPSVQTPQRITVSMIEQQRDHLKMRSCSYGPARFVIEKICGLEVPPPFYAEIYRPSSDGVETDLTPLFRQRLFEKIESCHTNTLIQWIAKRTYDLLLPFATFYISSITDNILEMAIQWIKAPPSPEGSKEEVLVKLVRNWMAVTSGAYNQVANAPASQSRDFHVMMEEALQMPERNGGLSQQELFASVVKTVLQTFGPKIRWSEMIDRHFVSEIPEHMTFHFLNPLVKGLNSFCSLCLKAFVFVPQWIGNQALQAGAKLALSHTSLLKEQSEKALESLRRNTPASYAMHKLIFQKQQKILAWLKQSLQNERESGDELPSRNTNIKKVELRALVEYSLEILNKGQYRTQDRLHNYLNHSAPLRDRAMHELENTFLPEIMETAIRTISITMEAMTKEEEMLQILYDSLDIANNTFEARQPVSEEEFAAVERGIRDMTDQILETTLFYAIGEKFDFTNTKQKKGISQFMHALKTQTQLFADALNPLARQIGNAEPITASDLKDKITAMIDASSKYHSDRVAALAATDGNHNLHTETKYHLNELSRGLITRCTPSVERLNAMKGQSDEMLFYNKLLQPLLMSYQSQRNLAEALQNQRTPFEELTSCKQLLFDLQRHLETLRLNRCPQPLFNEIQRFHQESSHLFEEIGRLQKTENLLQQVLALFSTLKQKKITEMHTPPSAELKNLEQQLRTLLDTLPSPNTQTHLKELVLSLMQASQTDSILSTAARFSSACIEIGSGNLATIHRHLATLKNSRALFQNKLSQSIQEYTQRYTRNQTSIQSHARELVTEVTTLNTWTQQQQEQRIWDLFAFDMQWVTEVVKTLSFDSARTKIQQLFDALYQRHNYIGLTNQVVLLPFLRSFGAHHLKQS